jgi:hypothetical protein
MGIRYTKQNQSHFFMKTMIPLLLLLAVAACKKKPENPPPTPYTISIEGKWVESTKRIDTLYFSPRCDYCASLPSFNLNSAVETPPGTRTSVNYIYTLRDDSIYMGKSGHTYEPTGYKIKERTDKKIVIDNFITARENLPAIITLVPIP